MRRVRRITVGAAAAAAVLATLGGAAYGVLAVSNATDAALRGRTVPTPLSAPAAADSPTPARTVEQTQTQTPAPRPEPKPVLEPGDRGDQVRELQARLSQLEWYVPPMTGRYDGPTRSAVQGFQGKRGLERSGEVDRRTWRALTSMTRQPTGDEMFNRAGPTLFGPGDVGPQVREIQARLRQIGWFFGDVTTSYGADTAAAVTGFQEKRRVPATGKVDQRTLDLLEGMTSEPTADELANRRPDPADGAPLDARCTTGRALCIDKSTSSLRWVVDGKVRVSLDVRFGASYSPTREGLFHVGWKSRDHVSSLYGSAMPFAMFFSGGQAVHYSSDFAARGYSGASHGCVNVRDYDALAALFDQVSVGDKVVIYWS
jgi:peptidoglycan hydrolase-like protein with peptidoglycan-binding domain